MARPKLSDAEWDRRANKTAGLLNDEDKQRFLNLLSHGKSCLKCCKAMHRSLGTLWNTRKDDPEFHAACEAAIKSAVIRAESYLQRIWEKAELVFETITYESDGTIKNRTVKTVPAGAAEVKALEIFLKANCPEKYNPGVKVTLTDEEITTSTPEELEQKLLEKINAKKLKKS